MDSFFSSFPLFPVAVASVVTDSWKYAAAEICNLLHTVRDSGMADIQTLEQKIESLVTSMNEQTDIIENLQGELMQQKQVSVTATYARNTHGLI